MSEVHAVVSSVGQGGKVRFKFEEPFQFRGSASTEADYQDVARYFDLLHLNYNRSCLECAFSGIGGGQIIDLLVSYIEKSFEYDLPAVLLHAVCVFDSQIVEKACKSQVYKTIASQQPSEFSIKVLSALQRYIGNDTLLPPILLQECVKPPVQQIPPSNVNIPRKLGGRSVPHMAPQTPPFSKFDPTSPVSSKSPQPFRKPDVDTPKTPISVSSHVAMFTQEIQTSAGNPRSRSNSQSKVENNAPTPKPVPSSVKPSPAKTGATKSSGSNLDLRKVTQQASVPSETLSSGPKLCLNGKMQSAEHFEEFFVVDKTIDGLRRAFEKRHPEVGNISQIWKVSLETGRKVLLTVDDSVENLPAHADIVFE